MPVSNYIIGWAPGALRFYRAALLLDLPEILNHLPESGRILDVGCGTGLAAYEIGRLRPALDVTGIDVDAKAIDSANRYNSRPNVRFEARPLSEMAGPFDCISFMDLLHHVEDADATRLMADCVPLLKTGGYLFVKDIDRNGGYFSYFMDRFVSFATPIRLRTIEGIRSLAPPALQPVFQLRKWKFPQPHIYLKFAPA